MKTFFPLCLALWCVHLLPAQAPTRMVYGSLGTTGTAGGYVYSYTVGEAFGHVFSNPVGALVLTMGFQQPNLLQQPLSVEGLALSAQWAGQDARLLWETDQEVSSDFFAIERSLDGQRFEEIGRKAAAGYADSPSSYEFFDKGAASLPAEELSYRLRMVDLDGQYTYSQVVSLRPSAFGKISVELYPNPAADQAFLRYLTKTSQGGKVMLHNAAGQQLWQDATPSGSGVIEIPVANLPAGVYTVSFFQQELSRSFRLVISR